jgi:hypothetical protein
LMLLFCMPSGSSALLLVFSPIGIGEKVPRHLKPRESTEDGFMLQQS